MNESGMDPFKERLSASHSILDTNGLRSYVERHYDIGEVSECRFLQFGLNDTYLIRTKTTNFILRAYRRGWRTESDIGYELDVLAHLASNGAKVSRALKRRDGKAFGAALAPEGERFLALFTFADGEPPDYEAQEEQQCRRYGRSVARIHAETERFASAHKRFELSLTTLIEQPLKAIRPLLSHRTIDDEYLAAFGEMLSGRIRELDARGDLEQGFCHGDLHGGNAHVDRDGELTFFDFDACGHGWRAYDVATFFWSTRTRELHKQRCRHFLRGYTEVRPLADASLASVPFFVAARHLWLVGTHAAMSRSHGSGWLDDRYFDRQLALLRAMDGECFGKTVQEVYL